MSGREVHTRPVSDGVETQGQEGDRSQSTGVGKDSEVGDKYWTLPWSGTSPKLK